MFSSNQILEISGCLSHNGELETALEFAIKYSGNYRRMTKSEIERGCKLLYQITEDGKYCIGWGFKEISDGWSEYPFDFDINIVSKIIRQHLAKADIDRGIYSGSYYKGFIMKCVPECLGNICEGIKNPFHGIVYFEPYTCFYSK